MAARAHRPPCAADHRRVGRTGRHRRAGGDGGGPGPRARPVAHRGAAPLARRRERGRRSVAGRLPGPDRPGAHRARRDLRARARRADRTRPRRDRCARPPDPEYLDTDTARLLASAAFAVGDPVRALHLAARAEQGLRAEGRLGLSRASSPSRRSPRSRPAGRPRGHRHGRGPAARDGDRAAALADRGAARIGDGDRAARRRGAALRPRDTRRAHRHRRHARLRGHALGDRTDPRRSPPGRGRPVEAVESWPGCSPPVRPAPRTPGSPRSRCSPRPRSGPIAATRRWPSSRPSSGSR